MKKISVCIAIFLCAFSTFTYAQFKKGTVMLGTAVGSTSYSGTHTNYTNENGTSRSTQGHSYSLSVDPQAGLFLSEHFVVGTSINVSFANAHSHTGNTSTAGEVSSTSNSKSNSTTFGLSPFIRYYFVGLPGSNWLYLQANGGIAGGSGKSSGSWENTSSTSSTNGKINNIFNWHTGANIGMTHFIAHNVGLDFALGYNYSHNHSNNLNTTTTVRKSNGNEAINTNNYITNTGTNGASISVGFHWFL